MESTNLGRRRGPGFVTPNACTECRKRRTKCDGQTLCGRCKSQGFECVYEVPTRTSKEEMRKEISQLRSRQHQFEQVFAALASQEGSDQILRQIQNGETLGTIRNRLRSLSSPLTPIENITTYPQFGNRQAINHALEPAQNAGSMQFTVHPSTNSFQMAPPNQLPMDLPQPWNVQRGEDILSNELLNSTSGLDPMNWEFNPTQSSSSSHPLVGVWHEQPMNPEFSSIIESARARGQDVILGDTTKSGKVPDNDDSKFQREQWTTVTSDRELVEHLLALYFCWEYPVFATLSKNHFMKDFRAGSTNYCSPLLVNALLALACRFSDRPSARADPDDSATAGAHFFAEALKLFQEEEDQRVLTTIQALGIMSIREGSRGRVHESIFFSGQSMRLAIEMGLHLDAENTGDDEENDAVEDEDKAVREATFWGAFSLDEAWSLCTGNLPHFSRNINLVTKPAILRLIESASWIPYRDDGGPLEQNCVQPSNIRSVYKTFCELSEIIHHTLYSFYSPGSSVTSKALLEAYSQYIHWYDTIPDTLRLGHNFTPAVLFSHLYYHFAILLLFRPFVKYSIIGSDVSPKEICNQASRAISAVIKSYSDLYSLRRTPSFVPYFVLSSTILHLASVQDDGSNTLSKAQLSQSLADLKKMSSCHGFAAQALDIVQFLGNMWGVDGDFDDILARRNLRHLSQEYLVGVDRLRPIIGDLPTVQHIQAQLSTDRSGIFTTSFYMKGLPLVATGEQLEVDGFRLLESPRQVQGSAVAVNS